MCYGFVFDAHTEDYARASGQSAIGRRGTHSNTVTAPAIIEIQRSHASFFTKMLRGPQSYVWGVKADAQFHVCMSRCMQL